MLSLSQKCHLIILDLFQNDDMIEDAVGLWKNEQLSKEKMMIIHLFTL